MDLLFTELGLIEKFEHYCQECILYRWIIAWLWILKILSRIVREKYKLRKRHHRLLERDI